MVAWLAKFNPLVMLLTSFLIAFLEKGSTEISTTFGLNESFSDIITGIIIFFIIGSEFFIQYSLKFREKEAK
jgi:simple sugar transport system permease protein